MTPVIIKYDAKKIIIEKNTKTNILSLRTGTFLYSIAFFSLIFFALYKNDYSDLVNVIIASFLLTAFFIVVFKNKEKFFTKKFTVEFLDNRISINNSVHAETKKLDRIIIKENISAYSVNAYYDIYAIFMGIKYSVIKGVSKDDRKEIVNAFKSFFNVSELPVEIR